MIPAFILYIISEVFYSVWADSPILITNKYEQKKWKNNLQSVLFAFLPTDFTLVCYANLVYFVRFSNRLIVRFP